jgi:negative regulator of flagellin synthesis FlgM
MSINIKGTSSKASQTSAKKAGSSSKNKSSKASTTNNTDSDSVSLTSGAANLQQIEQALNDIPVIDSKRVDAVSQSIEDGQYQINNEKIADRIIQTENELKPIKK